LHVFMGKLQFLLRDLRPIAHIKVIKLMKTITFAKRVEAKFDDDFICLVCLAGERNL
jgi:hypothetical protein